MLKFVKKQMKSCRRWLYGSCLERAIRHEGERCVRGLNAAAAFKDTGVRFFYDSNKKVYSYIDRRYGQPIYFFHKTRALMYRYGIHARAKVLSRDYFLDLIQIRDGDTIIDCGANIGELYFCFKLNGICIKYVAFEPSPLEFKALKMNCPDAEVHNIALWNRDENIDFYICSEHADSSIIQPARHQGSITVRGMRLENYITQPVRLLKLEAEGAEPEIIEGIGEKLPLIQYIAADVGFERGVDCESTLAPVTNMLLKKNFSLVKVNFPRVVALYRNESPAS